MVKAAPQRRGFNLKEGLVRTDGAKKTRGGEGETHRHVSQRRLRSSFFWTGFRVYSVPEPEVYLCILNNKIKTSGNIVKDVKTHLHLKDYLKNKKAC